MSKNKLHARLETGKPINPIKPALLTLAIAQALALQAVQAASIEVTSNLDDGSDCTLRDAIDTVNAGVNQNNGCIINGALGTADAISFGVGVAGSTIVTNGELILTQRVSINSGGSPTTIDANGVGRVIQVTSSTVELDKLTLTGGYATYDGGGINAYDSDVTLSNSTVSGNTGGGIYAYDSDVTLLNSSVTGNYGRGISAVIFSGVTLKNSTVSGNTATVNGGGIFAGRSVVTLTNSTVSGNTTGSDGGGINATFRGFITLTNSKVSGNSAGNTGGGIRVNDYSEVTLSNSTVSGNSTGTGGGISAISWSVVTLTNSTVSGNTAELDGGGIFSSVFSSLNLNNSTVSGNKAIDDGGGIFSYYSPITLTNSTVSDNTGGNGGGISADYNSPVTLSNSIVANSKGADCTISGSIATATADSIIEDGSCGTTAMAVDPLLGPLADNGGPTQTHALLAGSPAIDNGTGPGATATDQRGVAAVGVRDSGAYEFTAAMNALTIEKLINHRVRETPGEAAQLLAGTRYRASYKVTNNSPKRIYSVRVFESGQFVCNLYSLDPGESKQPYRCASLQAVLVGDNNVPARVTAKVSGSDEELASQTNAYYTGHSNVAGKLNVTHYINEINADTKASAVNVNSNEAVVKFRVENTGPIELYRVRLYHDPASPVNSGWQELCFKGTLMPGQVRYCKRPISITHTGLNKAFGRAQGLNANISATGYVNAVNPTYFNVVLP